MARRTSVSAEADEADTSPLSGTQTLDRGLSILEHAVLHRTNRAEIHTSLGLTRSTAARLVKRLVDQGFLAASSDGWLQAGPKLMRLGAIAAGQSDLVAVAGPHLNTLAAATRCSAFLGKRDGNYSVHLYRAPGSKTVLVSTPVGTRRRLAETSLGKALMFDDDPKTWERLFRAAAPEYQHGDFTSEMNEHLARGAVFHHGPPPESIRAIAAPVRGPTGEIAAAISIASVSLYLDAASMEALAPTVLATARAISSELGWSPDSPKK